MLDGPIDSSVRPRSGQRGIALILTLLVLSILIVLVAEFAFSAKVDRTVAQNSADSVKTLFAARGAIAYWRAQLRADRVKDKGNNAFYDSQNEDWAQAGAQQIPGGFGSVTVQTTICDCERFLNINLLQDPQRGPAVKEVLRRLARDPQFQIQSPDDLVEKIAAYVGAAGTTAQVGQSGRGPLFHPDELLSIPGLTPEDRQALLGAQPPPGSGGVPIPGILPFLTCYGTRLVNINTVGLDEHGSVVGQSTGTSAGPGTGGSGAGAPSGENPLLRALLPDHGQGGVDLTNQKEQVIQAWDQYRAGGVSGTATGPSPGGGTGSGTGSSTGDFKNLGELSQNVQGLAPFLQAPMVPPQQGQPQQQVLTLQQLLGVEATEYWIHVDATTRGSFTASYDAVIRRGIGDPMHQFDTILFREVPPPPSLAQTQNLSVPPPAPPPPGQTPHP